MTRPMGRRELWDTSCPDWADRIRNRQPLIPELPLFEDQAAKALRIFKRLRVPDIIGNPTYGEVCEDWVFDLVRAIFGAYDPIARRRMIREFFVLVPKKNGKTSIAAGILVTAAIMNERPEAEILLIAPTKKIAELAFKQASGIIRLDPVLTDLFHIQGHQKSITHRNTLTVLVIKAAEADVITGSKATFILIDETHVFAAKAKAADIFVEIRGSLAARPDGFLLQITTQSKEPPRGVFKEELGIARAVRDGQMQQPLLPVLYELPFELSKEGGWKDPATWGMVNPNLNRSVDEAFLTDELAKAERKGIRALMLFASQHLNVEIGQSLGGWRGSHYWAACTDARLRDLDYLLSVSEVVTIGIDGGGLDDLLGLVVAGRHRETQDWLLWGHAWVHQDMLELRQEIAPALQDFARLEQLTFVTEAKEDLDQMAAIVRHVHDSGLLPEESAIGLDSHGISEIQNSLTRAKIPEALLVGVSQGWRLSPVILGVERKLKEQTIWHGGQELLNWCVGNARAEMRGSNVFIEKETAGRSKIDVLIAALNACRLMDDAPSAAGLSVYQERGLLVL